MITDQELNKRLLTLKVIWFAMLMSLAIYLFLGIQVGPNIRSSINADAFNVLKTVLYIVAFITLIAIRYIRKLVLTGKSQYRQPTQTSQHPAFQKYSIAMILALAMSESIGVYGLVLSFLGKNTVDLYILILISATAMIIYRPRKDELVSLSKSIPGDSTAWNSNMT